MTRLIAAAAVVALAGLAGCASLPPNTDRVASTAFRDTDNTKLAEKFSGYRATNDSTSGVVLLLDGLNSFVARARLASVAERGIDAQYYLWHDDLVGRSLLALLKQAADRGVRVRLLIDDIDLAGKDHNVSTLSAHPHIEVRVFNPFSRKLNRGVQYVSRFRSVTRRMHNKSFTVDNQATVLGGRNIGNEYFDADPDIAFGDLDVLAVGPVVSEVSDAFDRYWNHALAYPIESLYDTPVSTSDAEAASDALDEYLKKNEDSRYAMALRQSPFGSAFVANTIPFEWGRARIIVDDPQKLGEGRGRTDLQLSGSVREMFAKAQREVVIFSPYFIPGKDGSDGLVRLAQQGVAVRVVTNSLASNNHRIVHAKYAKYRRRLLEAGVELYELKVNAVTGGIDVPFGTTKETVLHAKSFVVDRETVFIGSLNFDPRSFRENTEIGMIVESEPIADAVGDWFDTNISRVAYRLALEPTESGQTRLVWHGQSEQGTDAILHREPDTSWWTRFKTRLMSWLPIEALL